MASIINTMTIAAKIAMLVKLQTCSSSGICPGLNGTPERVMVSASARTAAKATAAATRWPLRSCAKKEVKGVLRRQNLTVDSLSASFRASGG